MRMPANPLLPSHILCAGAPTPALTKLPCLSAPALPVLPVLSDPFFCLLSAQCVFLWTRLLAAGRMVEAEQRRWPRPPCAARRAGVGRFCRCLLHPCVYRSPAAVLQTSKRSEMEPSGSGQQPSQTGQDDSVLGEVLVNQRSLRAGPEVRRPAPRQQRLLGSALCGLQPAPRPSTFARQRDDGARAG